MIDVASGIILALALLAVGWCVLIALIFIIPLPFILLAGGMSPSDYDATVKRIHYRFRNER